MHLPLGDNRAGSPSITVGGERKGLVSDAGRPRGEGTYGDLSAGDKGVFGERKGKKSVLLQNLSATGQTVETKSVPTLWNDLVFIKKRSKV